MTFDGSLRALFEGHATKEAGRDIIRGSDRVGQLAGAVVALFVALYFSILYDSGSGFFTSDFTSFDAALFFGFAYIGILPGLIRAMVGRKNIIRPLDIALSASILIVAIWFLTTFPFDFSHVADSMPGGLEFVISWITDGLAKIFLVIAIIVNMFLIPYTTLLYFFVSEKLMAK